MTRLRTLSDKVDDDGSSLSCTLPCVRPYTSEIEEKVEEVPETQRAVWIQFSRAGIQELEEDPDSERDKRRRDEE